VSEVPDTSGDGGPGDAGDGLASRRVSVRRVCCGEGQVNIVEMLHEAAIEAATSEKISQAKWVDALIWGWQKDVSMAAVLARAAQLPGGRKLAPFEWDAVARQAGGLCPRLAISDSLRNAARVWIANHAKLANDALWDGDIERAKKLMAAGGRAKDGRAQQIKQARAEMSKNMRGKVYLAPRSRDKSSDWKTVK